jgi:hypothetical protein
MRAALNSAHDNGAVTADMGAGQLTVAAIHLGRAWFRVPSRRAVFKLNSRRRHPPHWEAAWMKPCTCWSVIVSGSSTWRQILGLIVWRARLEEAHRLHPRGSEPRHGRALRFQDRSATAGLLN